MSLGQRGEGGRENTCYWTILGKLFHLGIPSVLIKRIVIPPYLLSQGPDKVRDALKSAGEDGEKRAIRSGQGGTIIWGVRGSK